jgi:hypothetical protein
VIFSDAIAPPYGPWQVQLVPDGGPNLMMWGYATSFSADPGPAPTPLEAIVDPE